MSAARTALVFLVALVLTILVGLCLSVFLIWCGLTFTVAVLGGIAGVWLAAFFFWRWAEKAGVLERN